MAPVEREVKDHNGRWYSLRIRPYKNVENKIDGAVLTLFDVDVPKRSEQRIRQVQQYAEILMEVIDQPVVVLDAGLRVCAVNDRFARTLGLNPAVVVGQPLSELNGSWDLKALEQQVQACSGTRSAFERVPVELDGSGAQRRTMWLTGRWVPWHESPDTPALLLAISTQDGPALSAGS